MGADWKWCVCADSNIDGERKCSRCRKTASICTVSGLIQTISLLEITGNFLWAELNTNMSTYL